MDFLKKISSPSTERTPLIAIAGKEGDDYDSGSEMDGSDYFEALGVKHASAARRESMAADRLSMRLLAIDDDDDEMEDRILHEVLNLDIGTQLITHSNREQPTEKDDAITTTVSSTINWKGVGGTICSMTTLFVLAFGMIGAAIWISNQFIGPPNQPVGPYELIERQVRSILSSK